MVSLGDDLDGPILVWVNKLNSFQTEEARRDGVARRGMRLAELGKADTPERAAIDSEVEQMTDDELRQAWVNQQAEEMYLAALDDIDSEPEWREKLDVIRRMPTLLEEANAAATTHAAPSCSTRRPATSRPSPSARQNKQGACPQGRRRQRPRGAGP